MLNKQIRKYNLSELQAGMIVAELMASVDGKSILGEGTILTDNRIRLLEQWGVERVSVYLDNTDAKIETSLPWSFDRASFNESLQRYCRPRKVQLLNPSACSSRSSSCQDAGVGQ